MQLVRKLFFFFLSFSVSAGNLILDLWPGAVCGYLTLLYCQIDPKNFIDVYPESCV